MDSNKLREMPPRLMIDQCKQFVSDRHKNLAEGLGFHQDFKLFVYDKYRSSRSG